MPAALGCRRSRLSTITAPYHDRGLCAAAATIRASNPDVQECSHRLCGRVGPKLSLMRRISTRAR